MPATSSISRGLVLQRSAAADDARRVSELVCAHSSQRRSRHRASVRALARRVHAQVAGCHGGSLAQHHAPRRRRTRAQSHLVAEYVDLEHAWAAPYSRCINGSPARSSSATPAPRRVTATEPGRRAEIIQRAADSALLSESTAYGAFAFQRAAELFTLCARSSHRPRRAWASSSSTHGEALSQRVGCCRAAPITVSRAVCECADAPHATAFARVSAARR